MFNIFLRMIRSKPLLFMIIIYLFIYLATIMNYATRTAVKHTGNYTTSDIHNPNHIDNNRSTVKPSDNTPWYMTGGNRRPVPISENKKPKLFPEDSPGYDRIIEQLMYALPKDEENRPIKTILLANGFSEWKVAEGRTEFTKTLCPVDRCTLTDFPGASAKADAVIFVMHATARHPNHYNFGVKRASKQMWIFYSLESPYHSNLNRRYFKRNLFNWTATYRRDSDIVAPYERWVHHEPPSRFIDKNYAANKTKKVVTFISNCESFNTRLQFARKLALFIQVDIIGICGSYVCYFDCMEVIKTYKFYLSFENANCRDYITEKFYINSLQQDVLPIVMGARPSEYAAVAPHKSYLHVDEFMNIEELAAYLHLLDEDEQLYNSYFKWKGTGEFINTFFFCRLCAMLHASDLRNRTAHYVDLESWWRKKACMPTREYGHDYNLQPLTSRK